MTIAIASDVDPFNDWLTNPLTADGQPAFEPNLTIKSKPFYPTDSMIQLELSDGPLDCTARYSWSGAGFGLDIRIKILPGTREIMGVRNYGMASYLNLGNRSIELRGFTEQQLLKMDALRIPRPQLVAPKMEPIDWGSPVKQPVWRLFVDGRFVTPEMSMRLV